MEILKKQSFGMLGSLSLQYFLGMVINMFGAAPNDPKFATESPLVKLSFLLHGLNGLVLPVFALSIFYFSRKTKDEVIQKTSLYGLVSVFTAALGGIFVISLPENIAEFASLLMALAFLAALIIYSKLYFVLRTK